MVVVCFIDCPPVCRVKFGNSNVYQHRHEVWLLNNASSFKKHSINNKTVFAYNFCQKRYHFRPQNVLWYHFVRVPFRLSMPHVKSWRSVWSFSSVVGDIYCLFIAESFFIKHDYRKLKKKTWIYKCCYSTLRQRNGAWFGTRLEKYVALHLYEYDPNRWSYSVVAFTVCLVMKSERTTTSI